MKRVPNRGWGGACRRADASRSAPRRGGRAAGAAALRAWSLAVLACLLAAACPGCKGRKGGAVNLVGSTSVQPFAELEAEEYQHKHPDRSVEVQGGGSTAGIQALANGLADIGTCSRLLKHAEAAVFEPIVIARDGLAVVVHPSNPLRNIRLADLRRLFAGGVSNWKQVGGDAREVRLIVREEGSGTREAFMGLVMGKERVSRRALVQESNGSVKELVKHDPAAVGYMSLGLVKGELGMLTIDGAAPTAEAVRAGKYPLARPFLFVLRKRSLPAPSVQAFIDYVLSAEGQAVLEREGLVRAK